MNKEQYQRLLALRKSEEEMFYRLIQITGRTPRELINKLPINPKRAHYLLQKWGNKYEYGVTLDLGWTINETIQDCEDAEYWKTKGSFYEE